MMLIKIWSHAADRQLKIVQLKYDDGQEETASSDGQFDVNRHSPDLQEKRPIGRDRSHNNQSIDSPKGGNEGDAHGDKSPIKGRNALAEADARIRLDAGSILPSRSDD